MACIKEIICLRWIQWKRSLRLEAVQKFWQTIPKSSKCTRLISICSIVNKELQGTIHTGEQRRMVNGLEEYVQCKSKKIPPCGFLTFFPKRLGIFNEFLQTYCMILYTLDCKFLFNYFQLWLSYSILSTITRRIFILHYNFNFCLFTQQMTSLVASCHIRHVYWHYKIVYFIVTCHRQRSTTYANV